MAEWGDIVEEIRAVTTAVVGRYRPSLAPREVEREVAVVVERLRTRSARLVRSVESERELEEFRRFIELVAEYSVVEVGEALLKEVERVTKRVAKGAPDLEGLAGEVAVTLLKGDRKELAYIMANAASLEDFDGLIGMHVGRERTRYNRQATVIDNLKPRCQKLLKREPFVVVARANDRAAYSLRGEKTAWAPPTESELAEAVAGVAQIPVVWSEESTRASIIYPLASLHLVLQTIARSFSAAFTIEDVTRVLERALVGYLPVFIYNHGKLTEHAGAWTSPEDEMLGNAAAERALAGLAGEPRGAVALLVLGAKKVEIAPLLGRTRPTVDKRLEEAGFVLQDAIEALPPQAERHALESIRLTLHREGMLLACAALLAHAVGPLPAAARRPSDGELAEAAEKVAATLEEGAKLSVYTIEWFRVALGSIADSLPTGFTADDAVAIIERAVRT